MAIGVNSMLNIGKGALFASQAAIHTTGNNVSNVNTPGYSRQAVIFQPNFSMDFNPGQVGQGVRATEVVRYFDRFVEDAYLKKFSTAAHQQTLYSQMRYVENLFNEANVDGIGTALTAMFDSWTKLSQSSNGTAAREELLSTAGTLADLIRSTDTSLRELEEEMDKLIREQVDEANRLIQQIAALNKEIKAHYVEGQNNPNTLMDERDQLVRALAGIIDVDVEDRGPGAEYRLTMKNGLVLVQHDVPFSLQYGSPSVINNLQTDSDFRDAAGKQLTAHFSGKDSHEYTLEVVTGGDVGGGAQFRVSIDGGQTWLKDENGQDRLFNANEETGSVRVGELDIWFDPANTTLVPPNGLTVGDKFTISPKNDVYWIEPTTGPYNISTQVYPNGSMNSMRITGGTLGGYLEFRDAKVGEYRDRLQAFTESLAWEVNRIHSQGAGLTPLSNVLGTYRVGRETAALGSPESLFQWSDRLQAGNLSFAVYGPDGKPVIPYPGSQALSSINFDPATDSLQDVVAAINGINFLDNDGNPHTPFTAAIYDGKLQVLTNPIPGSTPPTNYTFAITADTSGLAAALGINTFFTGETPGNFTVHPDLSTNINHVNSGRLNGAGEINPGDNSMAEEIGGLARKAVYISTTWNATTKQSLSDYYGTLVARVGADTYNAQYTAATETAMAQELYDRQEEISGVNLDEEMTNLIKFQASYKAAAKLITTADEMLQTLLGMKQ